MLESEVRIIIIVCLWDALMVFGGYRVIMGEWPWTVARKRRDMEKKDFRLELWNGGGSLSWKGSPIQGVTSVIRWLQQQISTQNENRSSEPSIGDGGHGRVSRSRHTNAEEEERTTGSDTVP